MSVLNDIWGFIKRNTLDKTNLDEQIVGGVKNFFNAPAQQVLQRRQSTFQYNPPPPPIIQPPKLPSNDVQSRISLLKQKLTLAGNEGIDNLKSIFKVNPSLTKAGDVDSSFGGQILKNAKDLAIKKGIFPTREYTSGGGTYKKRGVDYGQIMDNILNTGLKTLSPSIGMSSRITGVEPTKTLSSLDQILSRKLTDVHPIAGGAYDTGKYLIPGVFPYTVAKQIGNLPGETSAILNNPKLSTGQKAIEFGGREALPLLAYKYAPKIMKKIIPEKTYNSVAKLIGTKIASPFFRNLLTETARRSIGFGTGAGTINILNVAHQIKYGLDKGLDDKTIVDNIKSGIIPSTLGGGVMGAVFNAPSKRNAIVTKTESLNKIQDNKLLPKSTQTKNLNEIMTTNKPQSQDFTDFMNGKTKDIMSSPVAYKQPTTPTTPLMEQAKKYKSAEEYVKAQGTPVYHGTGSKFDTFVLPKGKNLGPDAIYFTPSESSARYYARGETPSIKEAYIKNAKLFDYENPTDVSKLWKELSTKSKDEIMGFETTDYVTMDKIKSDIQKGDYATIEKDTIQNAIRKLGYDGFHVRDYTGPKVQAIYKPELIKTRSQLIEEWNKAQTTTPTKSIKQSGNLGDIMSDMKNIETTVKTPEELATKYPIEQPIADWVKVKNENGLSLTQTALVRDLATAMKKSTNNHDLTKSIPKLVKIVKNNPEDMYPAIRTSADFSVKGNLKPWWKYWLKTEIPQWKQNEIDANKSLLTTEPPFQKPVSTKLSDLMSKKTVEAPMTKQQPLTTNISDTTKPFQVKTPSTGQSTSISQKKNKTLDEILASRDPENLINKRIKNLDTFISKEKIKSNVEAEFEGKRFLENHEDIKLQLYKATDKKGVPRTDLTDIIQGKKEIPKGLEKVIGAVRVYVSKLHPFRENPELGYIKDFYLQHIKQEDIANEIQKIKLGSDLWLPDNVMDLGSTKTRKGTLDLTHSKDFEKVWDRMGNEAMYDKYKGNFNITPEQREFRKNIIETIKTEVEANIEPKKSKLNIVRESTKAQGITNPKDIEYKYRIGIQRFNGFLDAMKREDIPLANSARRVRDAWRDEMDFIEDVNKIDSITWSKNIVKELGLKEEQIKIIKNGLDKRNPDEKQIYAEAIVRGMTKKRIQNFIDDVGKYRFTTNTEKYLNEQINRMLKVNLLREGLYSKAVKVATGLTYRAQILGNLSVGMQQKFESFRIPAFYKTKDVIQGIKRRITDIAKRRDILKDIKFEENDFRQLRQQINNYTKQNPDNIFTKFDEFLNKVGGAFIKFTENSKNKDYATVAEVVGENKGLKGQELKDFIRDEVFTNAYIMDKFNTPEFLQKSATGRALGQYSQYFWKDTERILDAVGVEKDTPLALKLLLVKALTMVITAAITGAGIDSIKRVAFPIGIGPAVTAMWEAGKIIYNVEQEKKRAKLDPENDNTFYRDSQKSNWTKLALGNVVPFGAQYKKTSGALDVSNKGYDETVTGRITHKSEDNPLVTWQTLAFGKGVGKNSRNYYAKEGGLFGTGESIPFTNIQGKRKYTSIPPTRSKLIKDMFERGDVEGGRDAIDKYRIRQDINRDFNKSLTPTETEKLKSFYKPKEKDALGNVIPNPQDSITIAGNKWNYFDVFQKEASKQREIASKTGEPINPIYNLLPEQQKIILRIQASPPGSQDAKDLKDFSSEWIADYYADQRKYSTVMKEKGLFTDNPYYDAMTVKVSPELQEKLDFYGTLPKGTGARSKFYKANPDVAEFFDASTKLTNEKRLMLGLLPTDYSKSNGYGSRSNFNSKLYYALKDIMKSYTDRKTLNKSLADLMSKKPKVKSLVQLMKKNKKKVDTNKSLDAILKEYQTKLFGKKKI